MNRFISFASEIEQLLSAIISSPTQHAQWLNTLSYLENCGARKIAACEHPTLVKEEMLKHAAEEFRHAHYLKKQIERVCFNPMDTYCLSSMLGSVATLHYLNALDVKTSRYLRHEGLSYPDLKSASYLLVTYAIELRAAELYPIYNTLLRKAGSKVTVKSILLEEKEHLHEMQEGLKLLPYGSTHAGRICSIEASLCSRWIESVYKDIRSLNS